MRKQKPDESETENNRWEMCCEWKGGEKKTMAKREGS